MSAGGPFSPPPDGPFVGMTIGHQLLMGLGILLLLPGGCALFFIVTLIVQGGLRVFANPYAVTFVPVMIGSLLTSVGGAWIVVATRRRSRPNVEAMTSPGDDREDHTLARITTVIVFVLFGLPAGLCSFYFTPLLLASLMKPAGSDQSGTALVAGLWLAGCALSAILGWSLVRTWRSGP